MSNLLIECLGALVATNQPAALSNLATQTIGISFTRIDTNNPIEQELEKIEEDDDVAAQEVDDWIKQNNQFATNGAAIPPTELNRRIRERFASCRKAYDDFIQKHPEYAPARVAYASFLEDIGQDDLEEEQLLKARELDPRLPSVWNQLGNYYGEHGPTTNAFICYEKAIALDPTEPIYYHNFGTTVYLYRKDVKEYYHIEEQQVFDKALLLYSNATRLDPTNFQLAYDVASTYYGIKPLRGNDALLSWTNTLNLAHDEIEREGVYVHLARIKIQLDKFPEAHQILNSVTNQMYADLKRRLTRNLNEKEHPELVTNSPPPSVASPLSGTNSTPAGH